MLESGLEKRLANLVPMKPGQNRYTTKRERIAGKLAELVAEYFPNGGYSVMDASRLKLAAQHYIDAETCRDPVTRQRATRCAEYLLSKLKPEPAAPRSAPALESARELLDRLADSEPF
jgi:hypothetical protein